MRGQDLARRQRKTCGGIGAHVLIGHAADPVRSQPTGAGTAFASAARARLAIQVKPHHYREMIVRAVLGTHPAMVAVVADSETLDMIVTALIQAELAKQILRAKGYGVTGQTIDATARLVPDADNK